MRNHKLTTRLFATLLSVAISSISAWGAIPPGYYNSLKGKQGAALKTELCNIINPHTKVSSYSALPQYFQKTDLYPGSTRWWDMYSNIPLYAPSFSGLNREHSFPKSWWGGSEATPAYTDLFHLYPGEAAANMAKSNYPLGVVTGTPTFDNGVSKVGPAATSGGARYVFEPADEYKGDFARTYFYVVTCYQDLTWASSYMWMLTQGTYPTLQTWASDLLLQWHKQDAVSEKEINRNEAVFSIQNNRNPFIDHPELAEYIWGDKRNTPYDPGDTPITPSEATLITPTRDIALDFGTVALGNECTSQLYFKGEQFTKPINFMIGGANMKFFSTSETSISATAVNSSSGVWVSIKYKPTETGTHNARFLIYGDEISGSFFVNLNGNCVARPNLATPVATAATDVTDDTYQANWTTTDTEVDYFVVTRKRYTNNAVETETFNAEDNFLILDGLASGQYDTYSVHSVLYGVESAESNEITVRNAGLDQVWADMPLAIEVYPGALRVRCSQPHHDAKVYAADGRLIRVFATIDDGFEFSLPAGVYILTTAEHRKPIRIAVL